MAGLSGGRRATVVVAAYLVSWLALDFAVENLKGVLDVSVWYPPAGLSVVLLLVFGVRYAPAVALAVLVHLLLFRDGAGYPLWLLVGIPTVYAAVYAGAVVLLVRGMRVDPRLPRARDVLRFVGVACLATPLVANVAVVTGYALAGFLPWSAFVANTLGAWAGEATGIGVLAPILLLALRRYPRAWAGVGETDQDGPNLEGYGIPSRRKIPELLGQVSLLALTVFVAYSGTRGTDLDYAYLVFVPLIWVAVRQGFARTTAAVLLVNAGAVALVGGSAAGPNPILLQFGLTTFTLMGLIVGALVSERRGTSERLLREASYDRLTGLLNRGPFLDVVTRTNAAGASQEKDLAVLVVDLDGFGTLNNTLGYEVGDKVLVLTAGRLERFAGGGWATARVAGNRFALAAYRTDGPEEAGRLADALLAELSRPYDLDDREVHLTARAGVALGGASPDGAERLLREANMALERAEARGRSGRAVFDRRMGEEIAARAATESDLRRSLAAGEGFVIHYQPVFSTNTREVVGAEALVRWQHPERGLLDPQEFVPLAEDAGLISPLGTWVLREALRDVRAWERSHGPPAPWVAVNVSARQAESPGFAGGVERALAESDLAPEQLRIELTESAWAQDTGSMGAALDRLAGAGIAVAVDDFGTGYSPLSNLQTLPASAVKIDRSFVSGLPLNPGDAAVVEAVVTMAEKMGIEVVAEGVENEEQFAFLRAAGCALAQGFLLGRPVAGEEFARSFLGRSDPGQGTEEGKT